MSTDKERIQQLEESYRQLWEQHLALKEKIRENYAEFKELREKAGVPSADSDQPVSHAKPVTTPVAQAEPVVVQAAKPVEVRPEDTRPSVKMPDAPAPKQQKPEAASTWEQYVGEQLLSKIGIVILVIGVGIGAKYAIDHQLLSPAMRIAGGYLIAAVLGLFAFRFREKYTGFSAILVSGAMAVTYFITYAAHQFYGLYPYWVTFVLLLLTTIATVWSALRYNQVIIAHFGLVGAYVLPVLLAREATHISNYFMYMSVINCGILVISFLRDWKSLYYVAFGWATCVFIFWFLPGTKITYNASLDQPVAITLLIVYFVLFQAVSLAYPLIRKKEFQGDDLLMVVPNMLSFFVMGQYVLSGERLGGMDAGFVFGLAVAVVFYLLWFVFRTIRPDDKLLQETHFVIGTGAMTLAFILELEGHSLPFVLIVETCILGWLAMRSNWRFLDILATVLTVISGCAILWNIGKIDTYQLGHPFASQSFALTFGGVVLAAAAFAAFRRQFPKELREQYSTSDGLLLLALIGGYCVIGSEIAVYYKHDYAVYNELNKSAIERVLGIHTEDITYGGKWLASMIMAMTAFTGVYWFFAVWLDRVVIGFRNSQWMQTLSVVMIGTLLLSVTINWGGVFEEEGTSGNLEWLYKISRYATFIAIVGIGWPWLRSGMKSQRLLMLVHIAILWILSLEMTHWLTVFGNQNAHKLSLSILWGIYAIYILYLGIVKSFAALRVTAMVILGITLVKLFFFDITRLSTIAKTVLFMLLGGLMLVGAYFYQRYKKNEETEEH
jgi:uncharacterized membrane protein